MVCCVPVFAQKQTLIPGAGEDPWPSMAPGPFIQFLELGGQDTGSVLLVNTNRPITAAKWRTAAVMPSHPQLSGVVSISSAKRLP